MAKKKFVVGCFNEEKKLFESVKAVRTEGYKLHDVYTPFAVHGLDKEMGLRETSLHTAGFIFGITGTTVAFLYIGWIFTMDWPLNYGGKPHFSFPAWIPIMFELTVLFASVGMVNTFCWLNKIMPFVRKHHFHPRATDDLFVLVIECTEHTNATDAENLLRHIGAIEAYTQYAEAGWWFASYSTDEEKSLHPFTEVV